MNEHDYQRGRRAMAQSVLQRIEPDLRVRGRGERGLLNERVSAIAALRDICAEHGDNDWDDDLNLADIIEKHLRRHLAGNK